MGIECGVVRPVLCPGLAPCVVASTFSCIAAFSDCHAIESLVLQQELQAATTGSSQAGPEIGRGVNSSCGPGTILCISNVEDDTTTACTSVTPDHFCNRGMFEYSTELEDPLAHRVRAAQRFPACYLVTSDFDSVLVVRSNERSLPRCLFH